MIYLSQVLKFSQLLEAVDIAGWTPLHIAGHMGRSEAVRFLLQALAPKVLDLDM